MNILAVSLAFPPLAYPRSIQVARLLKHTEASTVLFCADEPGARLDSTIEPDAEGKLKACIRIPVAKGRVAGLIDRSAYRFARGVWNRRNLVPDQYGGWGSAVLIEVERYINETAFRPDVIVTFAQPFTDHLIGMELRSRLGIPWLAHFSDPWVDNPFMPFDAPTRKLNLELERAVAEKADMLVFTSAETVDLFYAKYPAELKKKARVLPQCFDPELFQDRRDRESGAIKIRYLGNFYGRRTPEPLVSGLAKLSRFRPESLENVSFELVGSGDAEEVKALASPLPDGLMTVRPSVSYRESLDLMIDSDGLLIIDAPAKTSVFLPSKLIDYIGAGRPIFGITPEGTAAALIREVDGLVADPRDIAAVSEGLCLFVERLKVRRKGEATTAQHGDAVRERFMADRVAAAFRQMLEELRTGH